MSNALITKNKVELGKKFFRYVATNQAAISQ